MRSLRSRAMGFKPQQADSDAEIRNQPQGRDKLQRWPVTTFVKKNGGSMNQEIDWEENAPNQQQPGNDRDAERACTRARLTNQGRSGRLQTFTNRIGGSWSCELRLHFWAGKEDQPPDADSGDPEPEGPHDEAYAGHRGLSCGPGGSSGQRHEQHNQTDY